METKNIFFTDICFIQENSCFSLSSLQYSHTKPALTLYIDRYLLQSDAEIPSDFQAHEIGCIFCQDFESTPIKVSFLSLLFTNKFVCKALDESCEHLYYILYDECSVIPKYAIIRYSIEEIYCNRQDMAFHMKSMIYTKIQDIKFNICYANWLENYKNSISEWMNYSAQQNILIQDLNNQICSLKNEKSSEKDSEILKVSNYSFGECLLCCDRSKNIVFLPCGHVVACLYCTVKNMKIELNRKVAKKKLMKTCPLCKGVILQAREVII